MLEEETWNMLDEALEGYFDRGRCFSLSLSSFHFVFLPSFSSFILCYEGNRIEEERNEFTPR